MFGRKNKMKLKEIERTEFRVGDVVLVLYSNIGKEWTDSQIVVHSYWDLILKIDEETFYSVCLNVPRGAADNGIVGERFENSLYPIYDENVRMFVWQED